MRPGPNHMLFRHNICITAGSAYGARLRIEKICIGKWKGSSFDHREARLRFCKRVHRCLSKTCFVVLVSCLVFKSIWFYNTTNCKKRSHIFSHYSFIQLKKIHNLASCPVTKHICKENDLKEAIESVFQFWHQTVCAREWECFNTAVGTLHQCWIGKCFHKAKISAPGQVILKLPTHQKPNQAP